MKRRRISYRTMLAKSGDSISFFGIRMLTRTGSAPTSLARRTAAMVSGSDGVKVSGFGLRSSAV
jgi:hypothetical protein